MIKMLQNDVKLPTHRGTWSVIAKAEFDGRIVYELEHNTYGEDAGFAYVRPNGDLVMSECYNGLLDLEEASETGATGKYLEIAKPIDGKLQVVPA